MDDILDIEVVAEVEVDVEDEVDIEVEIEASGPAGKNGKSAYEIYVDNGGTLSETEWLDSLKGSPGEKGEDGSVWNQNNIFIAEIEGDFRCKPYGVSGYLDCTEKKVIYISREDYSNMKDMLTGKILYETEEYLMLGDNL